MSFQEVSGMKRESPQREVNYLHIRVPHIDRRMDLLWEDVHFDTAQVVIDIVKAYFTIPPSEELVLHDGSQIIHPDFIMEQWTVPGAMLFLSHLDEARDIAVNRTVAMERNVATLFNRINAIVNVARSRAEMEIPVARFGEDVKSVLTQEAFDRLCPSIDNTPYQTAPDPAFDPEDDTEGGPCDAGLGACSICSQLLIHKALPASEIRNLPCSHKFHSKCIHRWLTEDSVICPTCRAEVSSQDSDRKLLNTESQSRPLPLPQRTGIPEAYLGFPSMFM